MEQSSIDRLIINGPYEEPREYWRYDREGRQSPRRNRLLRDTRRLRPQGADILTSQEAYAQIQGT
jgi:hypothetical protein